MDIDPIQWLDSQGRYSSLEQEISSCISLLNYADCCMKVLRLWVRRQIIQEYLSIESNPDSLGDKEIILEWSSSQWSHRLNEIFLAKKALRCCRFFYVKS